MIFDPMYFVIVGPAMLLALWAQMRVKSAYAKYSRVAASSGLSGAQAAAHVLDAAGVRGVSIEAVRGFLSDHYDPRTKTLCLSPGVYSGRSLAAVGIASHEAGHAIQHARRYAPLALRSYIVPAASFGSWMAFPMIFLGFLMHSAGLVQAGIILFTALVLFQFVTLPVEFNASRRAKAALASSGIVSGREEMAGVSAVLGAASWTYVAAAVSAALQLLYFVMRFGGVGGSD